MAAVNLQLPPGFRFHPTDEELVIHYLCRKRASQSIAVPIIAEIELYNHDPWDLPSLALYGEKEWYFFRPRDRKYPNRAAGSGYWKATGADKPIGDPKPVGMKKALVFYKGKAPRGAKTNWIMHEYRLADVDRSARKKKKNNSNFRLDDWVLCRIYRKKGIIERAFARAGSPKMMTAVTSEEGTEPVILSSSLVDFDVSMYLEASESMSPGVQITQHDDACDELHSSKDVTGGLEQTDTITDCSDLNTSGITTGDVMDGLQFWNMVWEDLNIGRDATTEWEENRASCMELYSNRDDEQIDPVRVDSDKEVVIVSESKGSKENKKLFNITYEQLQPHFGKPLAVAAEKLRVSKSTIKRRLPELGIKRWPNDPKYIDNPSLYMGSTQGDHAGASKRQRVVESTGNNSSLPNEPIQDANGKERDQNVGELARDESVTIKATFEEDTEMFELSLPPKMDRLNQEVASRFDIEAGTFKLRYLDEDGDRIVLRRDDSLSLCLKNMKRLGKKTIKIYVESIRK